ncbi:MAG: hypothetical protein DRJ35_08105, partial [Thermoprotei archaeon]
IKSSKGWNYTESIIVHVSDSEGKAMIEGSVDLSNMRILSRIAKIPKEGTPQLLIFYRDKKEVFVNIDGSWVKVGEHEWHIEDTILYRIIEAMYKIGEFSTTTIQENGTEYLVISAETSKDKRLDEIYLELYNIASPCKETPQYTHVKITLKVMYEQDIPDTLSISFFSGNKLIMEMNYKVWSFDQEVKISPPT